MCAYRLKQAAVLGLTVHLFVGSQVRAETVTATATTLVSGRQDPRDGTVHTVVPFLEMVTVEARDVKNPVLDDLGVVMSGWGEAVAGDPRDGKQALGDVDLAYIEGTFRHRFLALRLGRHFVVPGAAAMVQIDGISTEFKLGKGAGFAAYFGSPVTPRFAFNRGDVVGGGRLFWRHSFATEVGLSFMELRGDGELGRRDAALDLHYQILPDLSLSGLGRWSIAEERLAEADLALSWQLHPSFDIAADVRRTAPDLFLPRYSIFSVFAQERRDEVGGFADWRVFRILDVIADFHAVHQDATWGSNGSLKAAFRLNDRGWTRFGLEGRRLDTESNGYLMLRAYAWRRLTTKLGALADVQAVDLQHDINGQTKSYYATASAVWDANASWRVVLTGVANSTPYVKQGFEGLLKVVYNGGRTIVQESRP